MGKLRCSRLLLILLFGMSLALERAAQVQAQSPVSQFKPQKCPFTLPDKVRDGEDLLCGYVNVPENYEKPQGKQIFVAVAIIKSFSQNKDPEPLIFLNGGPGAWLLTFLQYNFGFFQGFSGHRDVILFDQRGVGLSQPALNCPEIISTAQHSFDETSPKWNKQATDAALSCQQRLLSEGINLEAYNTEQSASDVESIRQALGYKQVNLMGASYGTRLALSVMRSYPNSIRSVVLDSVVPPDIDMLGNIVPSADRSFKQLFDSCKSQPSCSRAFPQLEKQFYQAVDDLNKKPVSVTVLVQKNRQLRVLVDGDRLVEYMFDSLYRAANIPKLPRNIYQASNGHLNEVATWIGNVVSGAETSSEAAFYSVYCHDEFSLASSGKLQAEAKDHPIQLTNYFQVDKYLQLCQAWRGSKSPAAEHLPVTSSIPTLILSGSFDPVTPPSYARQIARDLPNSFIFEIPNNGHAPSFNNLCAYEIVRWFLADPNSKPIDPCLDDWTAPIFVVPASALDIHMIPLHDSRLGMDALVPEGWFKTQNGDYSAFGDDQSIRMYHRLRRDGTNGYLQYLKNTYKLDDIPGVSETRQLNGKTWSIYNIHLKDEFLQAAITVANSKAYVIALFTPTEEDARILYEKVLLPDMDALTILY